MLFLVVGAVRVANSVCVFGFVCGGWRGEGNAG